MFDLGSLFAELEEPQQQAAKPEPAEEQEPEDASLPGPLELAALIQERYSPTEVFALVCELVRPAQVEPAAEPEPRAPVPSAPEIPIRAGGGGPVARRGDTAIKAVTASAEMEPAADFGPTVWTYAEVARYLGCKRDALARAVQLCSREHPDARVTRLLSADGTRAAERRDGLAIWHLS